MALQDTACDSWVEAVKTSCAPLDGPFLPCIIEAQLRRNSLYPDHVAPAGISRSRGRRLDGGRIAAGPPGILDHICSATIVIRPGQRCMGAKGFGIDGYLPVSGSTG